MAEEASASVNETLAQPNAAAKSNEATIAIATEEGGTESTCNNNNNNDKSEASAVTSSDGDREKTLEFADELMEKGAKAMKDSDFGEASECFSRSLEIRVAHFGELDPRCVKTYYKYGCALLYKAQEEADPLGAVPKKEGESQQESVNAGSAKNVVNGESSTASVSSNAEQDANLIHQEGALDDGVSSEKDQEEDNEGSDVEDLAEGDEDETDLDLAWKMLDVARAIIEKHNSGDTMEKVEVLSALAEVALEREDFETSLSDYQNALSCLERLVEPDSRHIAELNFRICLCLEIGSKPDEAIPYCQKAISVCKSRVQRLMIESKSFSESTASSAASEDQGVQQSSDVVKSNNAVTDKQTEIETLTELCGDLEKKLEDLQQLVSNPRSILGELLGMMSAKAKAGEKSASSAAVGSSQMGTANNNGGFDSPTISTAHTNGSSGVTHLGVVGRGVKRTLTNSGTAESNPGKKPAVDSSEGNGEGKES
ncbi:NASP-related protein sim3 [Rosa rugosa]|uniref:NASP-related protein sim3 n=1 Tax=Rosa rugosa TaxID=74645 RepID=UPI002B401A8F|nr:NASP-related protein sim3 [Rosa rugosa]